MSENGLRYAPTIGDFNNMPEEDLEMLKGATEFDTELFVSIFCSHLIDHIPQFHKEKYKNYDDLTSGKIKNLAEIVHRGSAKTTVKIFNIAKKICHKQTDFTLLLSEVVDQSERNLKSLKILLTESPLIVKLFGYLDPAVKGNQDNARQITFANGSRVECKGYKSSFRGLLDNFNRPDEVASDDFEGDLAAESEVIRNKIYKIITNVILPLGSKRTKLLFQGTIVHPDSFLAKTLDVEKRGTRSSLFMEPIGRVFNSQISSKIPVGGKAWMENGVWRAEYPDFGTPTWKEEQDLDFIKTQWLGAKTIDNGDHYWGFLQERYNIPRAAGNPQIDISMVEQHSCVFVSQYGINYLKYSNGKKVRCRTFLGVDNANSLKAEADRTVYCVMAKTFSGHEIILKIRAGRFTLQERIDSLFELNDMYRFEHATIEAYNFQNDYIDVVKIEQRKRKKWFSIKSYSVNKSKTNKYMESICPQINSGKTGYIRGCENIDLFFQEAKHFSGGIRDHDDTLDGYYLSRNETESYYVENSNVDLLIAQKKHEALNQHKHYGKDSWTVL